MGDQEGIKVIGWDKPTITKAELGAILGEILEEFAWKGAMMDTPLGELFPESDEKPFHKWVMAIHVVAKAAGVQIIKTEKTKQLLGEAEEEDTKVKV